MRQGVYILMAATFTLFGCGQEKKYTYKISDFKPELKRHLAKIVAVGVLPNAPDTLTSNFLRDSCEKQELLKLICHENPLVRVMAYRAIINRNEPDYFSILLNHLDDTTNITWWYYDDAARDFMVSDLMIRKAERKLTPPQKDSLVDEILFKHNYLGSAQWMIHDIKPKQKYYSIIRVAAQKNLNSCHDLSNTYSLAKFKKQEDIALIKRNFSEYTDNPNCNSYIFKTAIVFPDTAFFPLLKKYFDTKIKRGKQDGYDDLKHYCLAVSMFKNKSSLKILTALTKKETYPDAWYLPHNKGYVFTAIHKSPSPIYDSLYKELKPEMSDFVIKSLVKTDYEDRPTW